jgi:hypothetical protein
LQVNSKELTQRLAINGQQNITMDLGRSKTIHSTNICRKHMTYSIIYGSIIGPSDTRKNWLIIPPIGI